MDRSSLSLHIATVMPPRSRRCSKKNRRTVHVSVFKYTPVPLPDRDWAELHPDLISCILHRLDQPELLIGGVAGVCRSWRRAARKEPELWRRIDLRSGLTFVPPFRTEVSLPTMVRAAVRYSAGHCDAFLGDLITGDTLLFLAQRSPYLKSLHLMSCFATNEEFAKAIKMLPLLEELEISICPCLSEKKAVELVAKACPMMKHLRLVRYIFLPFRDHVDEVAFVVARIKKLVSLHLVGLHVSDLELMAILDNCPDLEYLNMRDCYPLVVDDNLRFKFPNINIDDREYSSDNDCNYLYAHRYYPTCMEFSPSYSEYDDDSSDVDDYCIDGDNDIDDDDLEEHEKILDIKNMRRYLQ